MKHEQLYEKITTLYPEFKMSSGPDNPFLLKQVELQNDSDGTGSYIAKWEHPSIPRPTDDVLLSVVIPSDYVY